MTRHRQDYPSLLLQHEITLFPQIIFRTAATSSKAYSLDPQKNNVLCTVCESKGAIVAAGLVLVGEDSVEVEAAQRG